MSPPADSNTAQWVNNGVATIERSAGRLELIRKDVSRTLCPPILPPLAQECEAV
jgi:hypothetical protein